MNVPDKRSRLAPSTGFLCALVGVLVSILAWVGPWSWPAWPAMAVTFTIFTPERPFVALPLPVRNAVLVLVITWNVAAWALVAHALDRLRRRIRF